ncbi:hypothetical protein SPRG_11099 [Saprolegnia parasitica CBS 223.65]|uniref:Uncharacterized protein n=1 Tax=Saprolegnia parasitica (strain CBS 223.65) TaxID=695850 RepID=A0A067CAU7_SAPPC|nr:hypothetical protein SPRG_11099 [Saprolegnia parasitica CBS 223.65]KDO23651.1 hypothetical protein SPRG_11099 [Saprolegnia parasitica CBS 223.65]|eukprot:XP_012205634.1 hypothetical protein SPRG_11099 [Saprolegnia parasitica CBS 223.65]
MQENKENVTTNSQLGDAMGATQPAGAPAAAPAFGYIFPGCTKPLDEMTQDEIEAGVRAGILPPKALYPTAVKIIKAPLPGTTKPIAPTPPGVFKVFLYLIDELANEAIVADPHGIYPLEFEGIDKIVQLHSAFPEAIWEL